MAKFQNWIIVKILDNTLTWSTYGKWGSNPTHARIFTKAGRKSYLLPFGGKWVLRT